MTQYTPGPWIARPDPANSRRWRIHAVDKNRSAIASTAFWLESDSREEEAANARLIAAAPDMLEALQKIAAGAGIYGAQAREYKEIAQMALDKLRK